MTNETLQPPQTPPRPLERPIGDRVVGGVAAALARRLDVGVGWIRTAFIVLAFFGGLGIALYAIGWVSIRGEGESASIAERALDGFEGGTAWVGGLLMVIAAMMLVGWFDIMSGEIVVAAGLFVAGLLVYQGRFPRIGGDDGDGPGAAPPGSGGHRHAAAEEADETTVLDAAAGDDVDVMARARAEVDADTHRFDAAGFGGGSAGSDAVPLAAQPPPARPVRPCSILGTLSAAAMLITFGVMALLDRLDIIYSDPEHYLGAAVLIAGVALVAGSWFGRARGLIAFGVIVAPLAILASAVGHIPFDGEFGEAAFRPGTPAELPASTERAAGRILLDLSDLDPLAAEAAVALDVGAGEISVVVPDHLDVVVDASVGVGHISTPFGDTNWLGLERSVELSGDGATLTVDAEVGVGHIEIIGSGG